ncbi:MAG: GH13_16 / GH13_36 / GH13_17 / GH13_4 / GH 13 / GH13_31 / GH13_23 / GH13_40 / GH13_35 / GH13 _29 / GH13_30 / GH13_20 / GH13_2 / GH13_1 / GH13 _34 / GH13_18 / GH13_19 / GH13_21 / GH13_37 / GH13 _10 / GH13_26 [uncultured Thermomicrobiales bacterium]|jgi:maltose alpha-D-glucosyltransferase/alpha-amylase|uniref:maltose alpha-D-glucosyltransferase n=1 Tax=uncultured Thermomicrobiales bacterium TaxID=1645740 RepID=A0A6J4U9I2_9BACT|nr:MAG: GH13_16 / GH13_36 / GH13_17 / GH13_4 / GH 13 / GH13_31 / GH13_23 / GH13_40 / GH13_35 / GH13 _29 / GH13_30 / GH13_20 / GH13_2 / GH13_1 / GH13 _34 / GH13_18 / GH13_19 / GH13_21 / GH13_37 / GH13 _10 / GH13_26 [uncultured Thermomicrobiales bacterium]
MTDATDRWYQDAIFYEAPVKSFYDSDNDGIGDFRGMTEKLDYVRDLGVDCIWLLPMYPSPLQDDGYDIADFSSILPDYGTVDDMRTFLDAAHARGIRVVADLVVNHTSDQHRWFQEGRKDPASPYHDYYVWSDDATRYPEVRIIFTDTEVSNWSFDPVAKKHFWHRFFSHQPDLNYDNPAVHDEMLDIVRFWLALGLDGFRCDAVPYLYERDGTNGENLPETHEFLRKLRRMVDEEFPGKILLAEANQWPSDVVEYFGSVEQPEFHMAFHFPLMPRMFMAMRRETRTPIVEIMGQTPEIPNGSQWAIFLRNHDELTLEMVTDIDRDYMYYEYAKDPRMRLNLGIRRRLAPLLDNGRRQIEMMNSLLLSMPGTPVIYYGDEIGMGDNIYLGDRNGVRTPMQWSGDRNGGFSRADWARLYSPVIMDPVYGYQAVNVEAQERTPTSLLKWMQRLIKVRKKYKAFGRGSLWFLHPDNLKVMPYIRQYEGETILCVVNLSRFAQPAELDLRDFAGYRPVELIGETPFPEIGELPYFITLGPHAFLWFRLEPPAAEGE